MKFTEKQTDLHIKAIAKLSSIKVLTSMITDHTDSSCVADYITLRSIAQVEYAAIMRNLIEDYLPGDENNAIPIADILS
jgi:hypothetical protein